MFMGNFSTALRIVTLPQPAHYRAAQSGLRLRIWRDK
jgi:hypothetical protein